MGKEEREGERGGGWERQRRERERRERERRERERRENEREWEREKRK